MKVTTAQTVSGETFAETTDNPGSWVYLGELLWPLPPQLSPRMAGWLETGTGQAPWTGRDGVERRRIVSERVYDTTEIHDNDRLHAGPIERVLR